MITTIGKSYEKRCVVPKLSDTGCCVGDDCMAWKFWVQPPGSQLQAIKLPHGIKDKDKLGYCGMTGIY
jgi:hypothetical protein